MSSAKTMTAEEALAELQQLQTDGVILFEKEPTVHDVWLEGWNPELQAKEVGSVAGVTVTYLGSGTLTQPVPPRQAGAPDRLDARNALAFVRFCQWLKASYGVHTLYHLGVSGGGVTSSGKPRVDCHGQGRAVDFVGVAGDFPSEGEQIPFTLTVTDNWSVDTPATPGGSWPEGTGANVHYRLTEPEADPFAAQFFQDVYAFVAAEWQDQSPGPDDPGGTTIETASFIMNPDHPHSAPGTPNGREAHANHMHWQIGVTGTA